METTVIALPTKKPGGLDAGLDSHFGHCGVYTLVEIENGKVAAVRELPCALHQQGGCMSPVNELAANKVQAFIAGGMGIRPLMGFRQLGIEVLHGEGYSTVRHAVDAFIAGKLQPFATEHTCKGSTEHACKGSTAAKNLPPSL